MATKPEPEKQDQQKGDRNTQRGSSGIMRQHRAARERLSYLMNPRASNSAIGTTTQRAKIVAMLFSDAVEVEEEIPVEGEVELVAGGVYDGGRGAHVGLVDVVGEVLEVPDDFVELANV